MDDRRRALRVVQNSAYRSTRWHFTRGADPAPPVHAGRGLAASAPRRAPSQMSGRARVPALAGVEMRQGRCPRGGLGRRRGSRLGQSSSGRKMCGATQLLQIGVAECRSPSGTGRRRSGKRHSTSEARSPATSSWMNRRYVHRRMRCAAIPEGLSSGGASGRSMAIVEFPVPNVTAWSEAIWAVRCARRRTLAPAPVPRQAAKGTRLTPGVRISVPGGAQVDSSRARPGTSDVLAAVHAGTALPVRVRRG